MAIIPAQPVNMSPRDELIAVVGFMIDDAAEAPDAIDPYELATGVVDEILATLDRLELNTKASSAMAIVDDGEAAFSTPSPIRDNIVWLERSDNPAR
ncbi:hypothetical protein [Kaistia sp. MMO-174]|uniref:hypothetical protein n=1 Tax=Kaistia sp. MMO-174 TaxID=3081256 RepID=UPI003017D134